MDNPFHPSVLPLTISLCLCLIIGVSESLHSLDEVEDKIDFYLYTDRTDPSHRELIVFNSLVQIPPITKMNPLLRTVIYVHGFSMPRFLIFKKNPLIPALLNSPYERVNLIVVDWVNLDAPDIPALMKLGLAYEYVVTAISAVTGKRLAEFILWLVRNGLTKLDRVQLIGFSVGADVSGFAGSDIRKLTGGKVGRITALDPGGLQYMWPFSMRNLKKEDATFVDVIHTNAGTFGTDVSLGSVNIWVNGGRDQFPQCLLSVPLPEPLCSHFYSLSVYAASLSQPLIACKIEEHLGILQNEETLICKKPVIVGPFIDQSVMGHYHLKAAVVVDFYAYHSPGLLRQDRIIESRSDNSSDSLVPNTEFKIKEWL